jgi:tetratricopeptide (TPR) repeat protein
VIYSSHPWYAQVRAVAHFRASSLQNPKSKLQNLLALTAFLAAATAALAQSTQPAPAALAPVAIVGIESAPEIDSRDLWMAAAIEETLCWRLRRVRGLAIMPTIRVYQARRELSDSPTDLPSWDRVVRLLGGAKRFAGVVSGQPTAATLKLELIDFGRADGLRQSASFGPKKLFDVLSEATAWSLTQLGVPQLDPQTQQLILGPPAESPSALEYFARAILAVRADNPRDALYYGEQALQYDALYRPAHLLLTQLEMRVKPQTRATAAIRLKRLAELVQRIGDKVDEAEIAQATGMLDVIAQSPEPARARFERALQVASEFGDPYGQLLALNRLSDLSLAASGSIDPKLPEADRKRIERERLDLAVDWQLKTLALLRRLGDVVAESPSAAKLALLYEKLGQFDKAVEYHQRTLAASLAAGSRKGQATAHMFLGQCYRQLQRTPEAIDSINRCLDLADETARPMARIALAELLQDAAVGRPAEAVQQLELACTELENIDLAGTLNALRSLAELRMKLNQRPEAIKTLDHALELAGALRSPEEPAIRKLLESWKTGKTP